MFGLIIWSVVFDYRVSIEIDPWSLNLNVQWHIISDPSDWDFFFLWKICNFQHAQKRRPRAEFSIWQDGSSSFHGTIRFWAFQLAKLTGKAIFITPPAAPPIIILKISDISEMVIDGATGKVLKMALTAIRGRAHMTSHLWVGWYVCHHGTT